MNQGILDAFGNPPSPSNIGMVLLTPNPIVPVSGATTVDLLTIFQTGGFKYDSAIIECIDIKTSVDSSLTLNLSNSGVSDTSTSYAQLTFSGTTAAVGSASITISPTIATGQLGGSSTICVSNLSSANLKKVSYVTVSMIDASNFTSRSGIVAYVGGAVSGFRLSLSGGNTFAKSGKILVYGLLSA
jgi:hypothetical protein